MKSFLLVVISISSFCFPAKSNDQIDFAIFTEQAETFVTVENKGTKLVRWQNYTASPLTVYELPPDPLVAVFENPFSKTLVGLSQKELLIWDIKSSEIVKRFSLENIIPYFEPFETGKSPGSFSDYFPKRNLISFVVGLSVYVISVESGELHLSKESDNLITSLRFLDSGNVISVELISLDKEQLVEINLETKVVKHLASGNVITIATNNDRTQYSVLSDNFLVSYNSNHTEINRVKTEESYFARRGLPMKYVTPGLVVFPYYSSIDFFSVSNDFLLSTQSEKQFDRAGFDTQNGLLLFYNNSNLFVKNLVGETLFETDLSSIDFLVKNGSLNGNEVSKLFDIESCKITSVQVDGSRYYATTTGGRLYIRDKESVLVDSVDILNTAITHFNLLGDERAFFGGYGRGTLYNIKEAQHKKVLNGHNSNIISSLKVDDVFFLTAGQDKKIVLWDMNKGVYIADVQFEGIPLSLTLKSSRTVAVTFTGGNKEEWDISYLMNEYSNPPRKMISGTTHSGAVMEIAFLPERDLMLSTDSDGYLKIWDARTMTPYLSLKPGREAFVSAVFNNEYNEVLAYQSTKIYHIDITTGKIKRETNVPPSYYDRLLFHQLSSFLSGPLFIVNNNKSTSQYAYHSGSGLFYFFHSTQNKYPPLGIATDKENNRIAFFGSEYVDIVSLKDKKVTNKINNPNNGSANIYVKRRIKFSPSGTKIAYEQNEKLIVYDLLENREVFAADKAQELAFISDNEIVYSTNRLQLDFYNRISVNKYDFVKKDYVFSIGVKDTYGITSIEYERNQNMLALGYANGDIEFLDANKGESIKRISIKVNGLKTKYNEANGLIMITVPGNTLAFDWKHLLLDKAIDYNIRFGPRFVVSPGGKYYIQAYGDLVEFYDAKSFNSLFSFPIESGSFGVDFKVTDDNKYITFLNFDKEVRVYDIESKSLAYKIEVEAKEWITDFQLVTVDKSTQLWMMVGEEKSVKSGKKASNGFESNYNRNWRIYDINKRKKIGETSFGESNYLTQFFITKDYKFTILRSGWKELAVIDNETKQLSKHLVKINGRLNKIFPITGNSHIAITDDNGYVYFVNIKSGTIEESLKISDSKVSDVSFFENQGSRYMITCSEEGITTLWDYISKDKLVTLVAYSPFDYMFLSPENYYTGTGGIAHAVSFKDKGKFYKFEQFDLIYNRPDLVLKGLSNDEKVKKAYHAAYERRLKTLGYDPKVFDTESAYMSVPAVSIQRESSDLQTRYKNLSFRVKAGDENYVIKKLYVWVNGVPVYGVKGLDIAKPTRLLDEAVNLELSIGLNTVKVSVVNEKGVESLKESFNVTYTGEERRVKTYYVGIGISDYKDKKYNLKYATKDVKDLHKMFSDRYGSDCVSFQLLDSLATRDNILSLKKEFLKTTVDDVVIISLSGHGVLDQNYNWYYATYDMNFDQPSLFGLLYEEIESLLEDIPARKKVLLIDACHSGEVDKEYFAEVSKLSNTKEVTSIPIGGKGSQPVNTKPKVGLENSFDLMKQRFTNLSKNNGSVVISAAGGMEYAYEGERWSNGVFTYCLINGLEQSKADKNKDSKVMINELKNYVSREVEKLTKGKQKPTSRQENIENDFGL